MKEFMNVMVDHKQIKEFARSCIQFLSFCDPGQVLELNGPLVSELMGQDNDNSINDAIEKTIWPSSNDITVTSLSNGINYYRYYRIYHHYCHCYSLRYIRRLLIIFNESSYGVTICATTPNTKRITWY